MILQDKRSFSERLLNPQKPEEEDKKEQRLTASQRLLGLNNGVGDMKEQVIQPLPQIQQRLRPDPNDMFTGGTLGGRTSLPPSRLEVAEYFNMDNSMVDPKLRIVESVAGIDAAQELLTKKFGADVKLLNVDGVGLVFKNPETNKITPIDAPGIDLGDMVVVAPEAFTMVGEVIGNLAGYRLGGPIGSAVGGGVGAATTKASVLELLKFFGVLDDDDISTGKEAALSGGLGVIGPVAAQTGRGVKRLFSSEGRAAEELANLGVNPKTATEGAELLNPLSKEVEEITGMPPQFTTGQKITQVDPVAGAAIQRVERESGVEGGLAVARQQEAIRQSLRENVNAGAPPDLLTTGAAGQEIKTVAAANIDATKIARQQEIDTIIGGAQKQLDNFAAGGTTDISGAVRESLTDGRDKVFKTISKLYNDVSKEVGDARIDVSGFREQAKMLERAEVLMPSLSAVRKDYIADAKVAGLEIIKKGGKNVKDIGASFEATRVALSDIRTELRRLKNTGAPQSSRDELQSLHNSLLKARNKSLSELDPKLADDILEADKQWGTAKKRLDEGIVGRIIQNKDGRFKVNDQKVFKSLVESRDTIDEITSLANEYPGINIVGDMKSAYLAKYADDVIEGGMSHDRFISQNRTKMQGLFSDKEMNKFVNAKSARAIVASKDKLNDELTEKLKREFNFEYELGNWTPEGLIESISKNSGTAVEKTRKLKGMLQGKHLDKWKSYVGLRKRRFINSFTNEQGDMSLSNLDAALKKDTGELGVAFGKQYVKNLKTTRDFMVADAKKGIRSSDLGQMSGGGNSAGDLFSFLRFLVFGPLDRSGARINRGVAFRDSRSEQAVQRILKDDDMFDRLVSNAVNRKRREPIINALSGLGLNFLVSEGRSAADRSLVEDLNPQAFNQIFQNNNPQ